MKRLLVTAAATLFTLTASADPVYHPAGPALVYGDVSNNQSITSNASNPAAAAMGYEPGKGDYSFGIVSSVGFGVEIGAADNIFNEIDAKGDDFQNNFSTLVTSTSPSNLGAALDTEFDSINSLLKTIEDEGYVKGFSTIHFPVMPVVISNDLLGGSLSLDINASVIGRIGLLQDAIIFDDAAAQAYIDDPTTIGSTTATFGDITVDVGSLVSPSPTITITNESTAVVKAAYLIETSLGYSRKVFNTEDGNLFAGVRGKYFQVELLQDIARIDNLANSENLFDDITDKDRISQTGIGLDIGALWVTSHYHLGATYANVNEPSFDFNTVDTTGYTKPGSRVKSILDEGLKYTMDSQLKLEGAFYSKNKHWVLGAALDANEVLDPVGDEYKWAVISAAYISDNGFIPSGRVGYRKNMAGSNLSYLTFGATWFKINLDVAYSTDSIEVDDSSVTRSLIVNMGLNVTF